MGALLGMSGWLKVRWEREIKCSNKIFCQVNQQPENTYRKLTESPRAKLLESVMFICFWISSHTVGKLGSSSLSA